MGTIVCRHRNETIFDRLADNYSRSLSFYWVGADENERQLKQIMLEPNSFRTHDIWDKKSETANLQWYQANKKGLESPQNVLMDVHINDNTFISLCGHICTTQDYDATGELFDVTEIIKDIASQQPLHGKHISYASRDIKNKIIHWNDIPSETVFKVVAGRDFDFGFHHARYSKYHRQAVLSKETTRYGEYCPFVDGAFYENINFYDDNATWYNPGRKFIQLNHAVTHEQFFDKDGYLCSTFNYKIVTAEEVHRYRNIFLFLV